MSTVRGARGEGAGRVSPGAGRRPSGSAPTPSSRRAEASWRHHPRGERLDHLDADSVPGGGAKARGGGRGTSPDPGLGASGRVWDGAGPCLGPRAGRDPSPRRRARGLDRAPAGRLPDVRRPFQTPRGSGPHPSWGAVVPHAQSPGGSCAPRRGRGLCLS